MSEFAGANAAAGAAGTAPTAPPSPAGPDEGRTAPPGGTGTESAGMPRIPETTGTGGFDDESAAGPDSRDPGSSWRTLATAGGHWGWALANGVIMVLAGIAMLAWPGASLLLLAVLFAVTLLVNGVVEVVAAIGDSAATTGRRVLLGILGALSLLAGVLCLRSPLHTLAAIAILVGSWWIISGVLQIVAAASEPVPGGRGWVILFGVLSMIAGFIVLLQPGISLLALEITLAIGLIVLGVVAAVDAFGARSRSRRATAR